MLLAAQTLAALLCTRVQILVTDQRKPWYHFITTTCAIIGGVFTVAGILDAVLYQTVKTFKKQQLGKNG